MKKILLFVTILVIALSSCGGAPKHEDGGKNYNDAITCYSVSGAIVFNYSNAEYGYISDSWLIFYTPDGIKIKTSLTCAVEFGD